MIFNKFLDAGLIPIGGDDDKYKKLLDASEELEDILKKDKKKIINYTLVALDEKISENETILLEVEDIVKKHWQLVRGQFNGEIPIRIYQGIILQTLYSIAKDNDIISTIVWLTGNSIYPLLVFSTKMKEIIKSFLEELGDRVEEFALSKWTIDKNPKVIRLSNLKFEVNELQLSKIEQQNLYEYLNAACGPNNKQNQPIPDANKFWPNNNHNWSHEFSDRASKGISNIVNKVLREQNNIVEKTTKTIEKQTNDYISKLKKDISDSLKDAIQSSVAVERRSQLLWWKETLYSTSQRKSYRDMNVFQSVIAMAFDLFELLPPICPVSVDYILNETFLELDYNAKSVTLKEFLDEVDKPDNEEFLNKYFPKIEKDVNRVSLVDFISEIIYSKVNIAESTIHKIGVSSEKKIKYEDVSIWILHCLLAKQLTE